MSLFLLVAQYAWYPVKGTFLLEKSRVYFVPRILGQLKESLLFTAMEFTIGQAVQLCTTTKQATTVLALFYFLLTESGRSCAIVSKKGSSNKFCDCMEQRDSHRTADHHCGTETWTGTGSRNQVRLQGNNDEKRTGKRYPGYVWFKSVMPIYSLSVSQDFSLIPNSMPSSSLALRNIY